MDGEHLEVPPDLVGDVIVEGGLGRKRSRARSIGDRMSKAEGDMIAKAVRDILYAIRDDQQRSKRDHHPNQQAQAGARQEDQGGNNP